MNYCVKMIVILLVLVTAACGKQNALVPAVNDDLEPILKSGDWKMTAFTITPALNGITDVIANNPACANDNLLRFMDNNIFYLDEGASKCNAADAQTDQGLWNYNRSIKQLTYSSTKAGAFVINVIQFDMKSIAGIRSVIINGNSYTFSGTLTRQ